MTVEQPSSNSPSFPFLLATGFGAGFAPVGPGTAGSLLGLFLFWPLAGVGWGWQVLVLVVLIVAGGPICGAAAKKLGAKDPQPIVLDEILGQAIALTCLPGGAYLRWEVWVAAFVLFRSFDILKPPPIRQCERLPGGWGILADDLAAGLVANLCVRLFLLVYPA